MRKNRAVVLMILVVFIILLCTSCATQPKQVPYGASQEQIAQVNAENIYGTANNLSILTNIQIITIIVSLITTLLTAML